MKPKPSPIWAAIGAIFATPVVAVLFVFLAALLLLCWPLMPFLVYLSERDDEDLAMRKNYRP